jgi:Fe/S biogenesis protein NfuA
MIQVTEAAKKKILEYLQSEEKGYSLRVAITGRNSQGFDYNLALVKDEERKPDDVVVDGEGFHIYIGAESAKNLQGATLDFVEQGGEAGFKVDNPNPVWTDPNAMAVQRVIETEINPGVAMHGGYVSLLDVQGDTAYIALGGGCQGCGMADVTLKQGIEVAIKKAVPAIARILDSTDHASGTNPYYKPAKGGDSPFA